MTVVHTVTADLNGDGVMVDITDRVDMTAGLTFNWGRTDWAAAEPIPGTLTLTLDNWDGALTPGSPTGLYLVGPAKGCAVYWDRREAGAGGTLAFTMGTPEIVFPNGSSGSSKVTVQCVDVLAQLALRIQRSMYDETVLLPPQGGTLPQAFWPCNEPSGSLAALDQSGRGAASLTAFGPLIGWANGGGPPQAGDPTIYFQSGVTALPGSHFVNYLQSTAEIDCPTWPYAYNWTLSLWFTAANVTAAAPSDVMVLAQVVMAEGHWIAFVARPQPGGALVELGFILSQAPDQMFGFAVPMRVSTQDTHLLSARAYLFPGGVGVEAQVDITSDEAINVVGLPTPPLSSRPVKVIIGAAPVGRPTMTDGAVSDWVGAVGKVALYSDQSVDLHLTLYQAGAYGFMDTEDARLARLLAYAGIATYLYHPDGVSPPSPEHLENQDTAGVNMLTSIAVALAEGRSQIVAAPRWYPLSATVIPAWIQPVYQPEPGNYLPRIIIDVEGQAQGVPPLSKEQTGQVASATASNRTLSASFTDPVLTARLGPISATVATALIDPQALARQAQDRVVRGRGRFLSATQVTIDLLTSPPPPGGWLAVVIGVMPSDRLRITGLPAPIVGLGQIDQLIVGGAEIWTAEQQQVTFNLCAADAPVVGYTAPETSGLLPGLPDTYWRASGDTALLAAVDQAATVIQTAAAAALFSTDPADYPMLLAVGGECVQVLAPPTLVDATTQQFTIVRGAATTWPRPHPAGEAVDVWLAPTVTL